MSDEELKIVQGGYRRSAQIKTVKPTERPYPYVTAYSEGIILPILQRHTVRNLRRFGLDNCATLLDEGTERIIEKDEETRLEILRDSLNTEKNSD